MVTGGEKNERIGLNIRSRNEEMPLRILSTVRVLVKTEKEVIQYSICVSVSKQEDHLSRKYRHYGRPKR